MKFYASEMATKALGLSPIGEPWRGGEEQCAMCARPLQSGMLANPLRVSSAYTSFLALTPSETVCGWCEVTRDQKCMRYLQRTLIREDGCYSLAKDAERAWMFLTPPKPPFAAVINQSSATATFHLHWRTPVTVDANLLYVRLEERVLMIRRPVLLDALQWSEAVARALDEAPRKGSVATTTRHHPFISLSRGLDSPAHGALLPKALALTGHQDLIHHLQHLWPGELWALATLAKANTPVAQAPPAVTAIA